MQNRSLIVLWNEIKLLGQEVRSKKLDGLVAWGKVKGKLSNYVMATHSDGIQLNKQFEELSESLDYKREEDDTDHAKVILSMGDIVLDNTVDYEHFFIQLFRIPKMMNYKLPVVKIMQIAYNVGQFTSCIAEGVYQPDIVLFFYENNLENLLTYVNRGLIIEDVQTLEMGGGNRRPGDNDYRHKYLKYKAKYSMARNRQM